MPPRFTPATEQALRDAGWFPERTVSDEQMNDWLVINWCPIYLPHGYTKISPKAWQALNEFGGLSIERGKDKKPPFVLNPLRIADLINPSWRWDTIAWQLGTDLFPLGTIEFKLEEKTGTHGVDRAVFMGNDGRVFIQDHPIYCLGNSIDEALEMVVSGERGEPIDELESEQIKSINNTINELIESREKQLMQGLWPNEATTLGQKKKSWYLGLLTITDWDAEAKRVCRAFGITEPCVFAGPLKLKTLRPVSDRQGFNKEKPSLGDGLFLVVNYSRRRSFTILNGEHKGLARVGVNWDGGYSRTQSKKGVLPQVLLKGLFNLGLLNPEAEEQLKISITQHEKLEWQLEFEALNNHPETKTR